MRPGSAADALLCWFRYLAARAAAEDVLRTALRGIAGAAGGAGDAAGTAPVLASAFSLMTKRSSELLLEGRWDPSCASKNGLL